jgi:hypothetical protein
MLSRPRPRLTYANVTATLALFIALGGSSYAALQLPKASVGPKQLKKNAVSSPKVKPGSLLLSDFRRSQRTKLRGPSGPEGAPGPAGAQGAVGPPGPTQGSASTEFAGAMPSPNPESDHATHVVTIPTSGRLYVFGRGTLDATCSAGGPRAGLYVDGVPVPASGMNYPEGMPSTNVAVSGVSEPVGPGQHVLTLQTDCTLGNGMGTGTSSAAVGAILLGGS